MRQSENSKVEITKEESSGLRGVTSSELDEEQGYVSTDTSNLLKIRGTYQNENDLSTESVCGDVQRNVACCLTALA